MKGNYLQLRKTFKKNDDERDADFRTPEGVERYDDLSYGPDKTFHMLDIYRPKDMKEKLPVIVSVHGGGFVYGDKERYQYYCMDLALRGFAVVNFSYRLAPETKFPAPLSDMTLVFAFMREHAKEYRMDLNHIFAVGDSAGAHILTSYAALMTNKKYAKKMHKLYKLEIENTLKISGVGLNCGEYMGRVSEEIMSSYLPTGSDEEYDLVDLPQYITSEFPPAYMMTAPGDFLKDRPYVMIQAFTEKGVPFVHRMYGSKLRPLGHVFHCDLKLPEAKLCNDDECAFFKSLI